MSLNIKYVELCKWIWDNVDNKKSNVDVIINRLKSQYTLSEEVEKTVRIQLNRNFLRLYREKWTKSSRRKDVFQSKYNGFLEKELIIQLDNNADSSNNINALHSNIIPSNSEVNGKAGRGRPRVSFEDASSRTKIRRATELANNHTIEELYLAITMKLRAKTTDNKNFDDQDDYDYDTGSINRALAMYSDADLTKRRYEKIRAHNKEMWGNTFYPPYKMITEAKNLCYPEHIYVCDTGASINIISLLEHTLKRILMTLDHKILRSCDKNLVFSGKYGMDGSSGQQTTRQPFTDNRIKLRTSDSEVENDYCPTEFSDASVFITNFVPLDVKTADKELLWLNSKPSSTLYCRPVNFQFVKESKITKSNYKSISKLLDKVQSYDLQIMDMTFNVTFDLKCSMIDGKTGYDLTNKKATSRFNICIVGPKKINDIPHILKLHCHTEFYKFGFPVLHSWIRFMEYILHICYNSDFQEYHAKGYNKDLKSSKKQSIQKALKDSIGLTVDVPKQGSGNTNTGNVARLFFSKYKAVSKIIGIDEEILKRLYVVLQLISTKQKVRLNELKSYCLETAEKCIEKYNWYKMPPSVHKVLIHGCDIMLQFPKPMGFYSEEPQECNNKIFRQARREHSRMLSRTETNEDIIHYLLFMSDPIISNSRIIEERDVINLIPEAQRFIIASE